MRLKLKYLLIVSISLSSIGAILGEFHWSPTGQHITATVYLTKGGDDNGGDNHTYVEKHVYIFDLRSNEIRSLIQE